jgi:hypothetical protein
MTCVFNAREKMCAQIQGKMLYFSAMPCQKIINKKNTREQLYAQIQADALVKKFQEQVPCV